MTILELIKELKLEQNRAVNLTEYATEIFYYDSFISAYNAVYDNTYDDDGRPPITEFTYVSNTTSENAAVVIFFVNNVLIMQLLSDVDISQQNIIFYKDIILDYNGFSISVGNRRINLSSSSNSSILFYGMKDGSKLIANIDSPVGSEVISANGRYNGIIGGTYEISFNNEQEDLDSHKCFKLAGTNVSICNCSIGLVNNTTTRSSEYIISIEQTKYVSIKNSKIIGTTTTPFTSMVGYAALNLSESIKSADIKNCIIKIDSNENCGYGYAIYSKAQKIKLTECDIQRIGYDSNENGGGCGLTTYTSDTDSPILCVVDNSYIHGEHSGICLNGNTQLYATNCNLSGSDHGGLYVAAYVTSRYTNSLDEIGQVKVGTECTAYLKDCELRKSNETSNGGGAFYCGYGASMYADNCKFIANSNAVCLNQRSFPLKSSTLYMSNCECLRPNGTTCQIRLSGPVNSGDRSDGLDYVTRSTIYIGNNNLYVLENTTSSSTDVYYTTEDYNIVPMYIKDFLKQTSQYLEELSLEKNNLYNICNELGCAVNKNTKISGLINSLDEISENLSGKDCDHEEIYNQGYEQAKLDSWNSFWDKFQANGTRANYSYAFCTWGTADTEAGWDETNFKPKYSFSNIKQGEFMFRLSRLRGSLIDILAERNLEFNTANCTTFNYMFGYAPNITEIPLINLTKYSSGNYVFCNCYALRKVSIVAKEGMAFGTNANSSWFYRCDSLTDLDISGTIGGMIDLRYSPLNKKSILSVINALSDTSTGITATFKLSAIDSAFETSEGVADGSESQEWLDLVATKTNWTISLI